MARRDERSAYREMARVIGEVEAEQQIAPTKREARFEDAVEAWFAHLEFEKRAKPSTLAGYRSLLAHPRPGERGQRGARIMREFAGRKLRSITTQDIQGFLGGMDREDVALARSTSTVSCSTRSSSTPGARMSSPCATTRSPGPGSVPKKAPARSRPSSQTN